MRILIAVFDRLFVEGGFRRFVYRLLGFGAAVALVGELLTNGTTDLAGAYALVAVLMFVGLYDG